MILLNRLLMKAETLSIYATLWLLEFPKFGDYHHACEWTAVIAQGVPPHPADAEVAKLLLNRSNNASTLRTVRASGRVRQ
jgi:hypothetical protein